MTMKSVPILICFAGITLSQFILGMGIIILSAKKQGMVRLLDQSGCSDYQRLPAASGLRLRRRNVPITTPRRISPVHIPPAQTHGDRVYKHLPSLRSVRVILNQARRYTDSSAPTSDLLAFSVFIYLVRRSRAAGLKIRMILDTIAEDATWYFLVIFTAHLVFILTLNLARVSATDLLFLVTANDFRLCALPANDPTPSSHVSHHQPHTNYKTLIIFVFTIISGIVVYVPRLTCALFMSMADVRF